MLSVFCPRSESHPISAPLFVIGAVLATFCVISGCGEPKVSPNALTTQSVTGKASETSELPDSGPPQLGRLALPLTFERHTGDLDVMSERRRIRALVVYSRSGFFYDKGHPKGISYEAVEEFQRFLNKKLKTGARKIIVTFSPVRPEELEAALTQGVGDFIATGVVVTPERKQRVGFTVPIATDVKEVVVTGPTGAAIEGVDDLSGNEVCVNPIANYYQNLQKVNESLRKTGKAPVIIQEADKNLTDEDLLEMVNAGLIPATVTFTQRADFWSKVFPKLVVHSEAVVASDGQLAWVTRKDSPKLEAVLDEFIEGHRIGTSFGNTLFRRYLQNTKWVKDATSTEEMKKFQAYVRFFQKYAAEYGFDYLMLVAQGYQESLLDQSRRSPSGAVGIMQVIPKYAAAAPINITHVDRAENNIQAGAKMLHNIAEIYFNDDKLDPMNKTLMVFASYNAGPSRIMRLRKKAASEGLDPNKWFGNVELLAAKDIGRETVQYVSNVYKYYVAYKLALQGKSSNEPRPGKN
jgi:membrane-bound lytic murein transglycosylase MltF